MSTLQLSNHSLSYLKTYRSYCSDTLVDFRAFAPRLVFFLTTAAEPSERT